MRGSEIEKVDRVKFTLTVQDRVNLWLENVTVITRSKVERYILFNNSCFI